MTPIPQENDPTFYVGAGPWTIFKTTVIAGRAHTRAYTNLDDTAPFCVVCSAPMLPDGLADTATRRAEWLRDTAAI